MTSTRRSRPRPGRVAVGRRVVSVLLIAAAIQFAASASADLGRGDGDGHGSGRSGEASASPSPTPSATAAPSASPEATASPSPEPSASASPSSSPTPTSEDAEPAEDATPQPSSSPEGGEVAALAVETRSRTLVAQLGDLVRFEVDVTNNSSETAEDVIVVDELPEEVRFVSVKQTEAVDAIQYGRHREREDLVWVLKPLSPGRTVRLSWTGRATATGDLLAVNEVSAQVEQREVARAQAATYLAAIKDVTHRNPPVDEVEHKRIVVTRVVPPAVLGSVDPVGRALPVTGNASGVVIIGLALVGLGAIVVMLTGSRRRRNLQVLAVAAALTVSACVSSGPDVAEPERDTHPSPPAAQPTAEPTEEPAEVKGRRIRRDDQPDRGPSERPEPVDRSGSDRADATETTALPPADQPPAPEPVVQRVVHIVTVPRELQTQPAPSLEGDNVMTYTWDPSQGVVQAASSVTVDPGAVASLLTSVTTDDPGIEATVTLENLSTDRLHVHGRFHHVISSSGAVVAELESNEVDVVLNPNGATEVVFNYLLPAGDYTVTSRFESA